MARSAGFGTTQRLGVTQRLALIFAVGAIAVTAVVTTGIQSQNRLT